MYMQHAASSQHSLQSFYLSILASFFHTHIHNELPSFTGRNGWFPHTHTHTQRASELNHGASALLRRSGADTAFSAEHGHSG